VTYFFGLDGISLWLVMLTTFLSPIAILCSFEAIKHRAKEYYVFMLVLETGMLGVFLALDFFLFYVFWEVMLVPMYFLSGCGAATGASTPPSSSSCIRSSEAWSCCWASWPFTSTRPGRPARTPLTCWS
jgi:hypothetical protein